MTTANDASNAAEIEYWNGPVAERWVREQTTLDRVLAPFGEAALQSAALAAGERVLDVGCGAGAMSLALAHRVGPKGSVLGVDISGPLLSRARERAKGKPNVEFVQADASEHAFEPESDVVFSRFGVMFFHDPVGAFTNLRRALREGGRFCFACWRSLEENIWMRVPVDAALSVVPQSAPPFSGDGPGPLSLADRGRVERTLAAAGLEDVQLQAFDADFVFSEAGLDEAVRFATQIGPAARILSGVEDADLRERAAKAIAAALSPHLRGQRVAVRGGAWIVGGRRG